MNEVAPPRISRGRAAVKRTRERGRRRREACVQIRPGGCDDAGRERRHVELVIGTEDEGCIDRSHARRRRRGAEDPADASGDRHRPASGSIEPLGSKDPRERAEDAARTIELEVLGYGQPSFIPRSYRREEGCEQEAGHGGNLG